MEVIKDAAAHPYMDQERQLMGLFKFSLNGVQNCRGETKIILRNELVIPFPKKYPLRPSSFEIGWKGTIYFGMEVIISILEADGL